MSTMANLDLALDNLAKRLTDGYDGTNDDYHRRIDGAVLAVEEVCGADPAAHLEGRIDFHAGNPDAWKAEAAAAPYRPEFAVGYPTTFSAKAIHVFDRRDNDDEP